MDGDMLEGKICGMLLSMMLEGIEVTFKLISIDLEEDPPSITDGVLCQELLEGC